MRVARYLEIQKIHLPETAIQPSLSMKHMCFMLLKALAKLIKIAAQVSFMTFRLAVEQSWPVFKLDLILLKCFSNTFD